MDRYMNAATCSVTLKTYPNRLNNSAFDLSSRELSRFLLLFSSLLLGTVCLN